MFKKLRNKFLLLNLITISVMMLIAFSSIYIITYNNVKTGIDMELHRIADFNRKPNINKAQPAPNFAEAPPVPDRSLSFSVLVDRKGNILAASSIFSMEEEFFENASSAALDKNTDSGRFKLDGSHWAFTKLPQPEGYKLVFLDITQQQAILANLVYTFLAVAAAMLIVIFLISRFFANKAIKPIQDAFDKQKQFIADASHELKTPLAVINTNIDVLLSNEEGSLKEQGKWLHYIKSETERMTKLTNDLLYLTQMDYSEAKMVFTNFNLSEAVENVILTMEAVIFENSIDLEYDIDPNLSINGSSEQIKQVVMILLDNAIKYTNSWGNIHVSMKKQHSSAVLTVTNTGDGIQEEHLSKIFDRFYRTDKSRARKSGGYGLGLAIAKAIIDHHKGRIYAKSTVNQSTSFIIELPCA